MNDDLINRLHGVIRPFILRRLKKDVEKQLPNKYEHVVRCHLSRRQQYLYEEYMGRTTTRSALSGGNFMGMMNILMQLRKVCNHTHTTTITHHHHPPPHHHHHHPPHHHPAQGLQPSGPL